MTVTVTSTEIAQFRSELANFPEALVALDAIEDCEGDLEDAAIGMAIQAGQEPDRSDRWLAGLAGRCRHIICQDEFIASASPGLAASLVPALATSAVIPVRLATPVALYVVKTGIHDFCGLTKS